MLFGGGPACSLGGKSPRTPCQLDDHSCRTEAGKTLRLESVSTGSPFFWQDLVFAIPVTVLFAPEWTY